MLPQQPPPKPQPAPDLQDLAQHQEFAAAPYTKRIVAQLTAENATLVTTLLNDFEGLTEVQIKVVLQRIKTQRHILKCLTTPTHLPQ